MTPSLATLVQSDITRLAATIYTAALLATLPIGIAGLATLLLRRGSAEARSLVWRSAVVGLLLVFVGRQLPMHLIAWAVPSALAAPLVALGRAQMIASLSAPVSITGPATTGGVATGAVMVVRALFVVYLIGITAVILPTVVATGRSCRRLAQLTEMRDESWMRNLAGVRDTLGLARMVRLYVDDNAAVPMTWGVLRPVVVLPRVAASWDFAQRRMVLLHELVHIRAGDWAFNLAARVVCALYWFHPGAWWVARGLRDECELTCDDRVIASGIRRSDYAELLMTAAAALRPSSAPAGVALALSQRGGLRARLAAVLDARHSVRPLRRRWTAVATAMTVTLAGPISAVQLAPTRDVLTTLMRDARWESRAYAVLGLAQRADSIAVARSAAEGDPSPRVRAWARYALGEQADRPDVSSIIRDH